jgi:arabinogalactan oligomer/maltooligosaccharide transport system permease protein
MSAIPTTKSEIRKAKINKFFRTLTVKKFVLGLLAYSWLIAMVLIVLTPVLWMVSASFTDTTSLSNVPVIPKFSEWSLANFKELFTYKSTTDQFLPDYVESFSTTFIIASLNTVLVVIFSSLVGFSFSRFRFKGKKQVLLSMMALQMFPSFMGMLALFMFFRQFGLLNNPVALTLIYTAGAIPYNTFIVRGFMRNIPKSLDEAASIDGATNMQIMFKVIVPLAVPIMGFIAVNAFMGPWLDYILPSVIMPQRQTVAIWLFRFMDPLSHEYAPVKFMSGALFLAVPIMCVQIYMQKYVIYGLTAGADKG